MYSHRIWCRGRSNRCDTAVGESPGSRRTARSRALDAERVHKKGGLGTKHVLLLLFVFALLIRLGYLIEISNDPFFTTPLQDEAYYLSWAHRIADGAWLGDGPFERAPLYAYVLALLLTLVGDRENLIRIIQLVISAFSAPLVYLVCLRSP